MLRNLIIIFFILIFLAMLTGCSERVVYLNKVEEVVVEKPVLPDIPEIDCEFNGEPTVVINKLIECISQQKKVLDTLREASKNNTYQIFKKEQK